MYFLGELIVLSSMIGGFAIVGGNFSVLLHPAEYVIILGVSFGAFLAGNRGHNIGETKKYVLATLTNKNYGEKEYFDILLAMYSVFKVARSKSLVELESHIENPQNSNIFSKFPTFQNNKHLITLFCDYLRVVSMGIEDPFIIEDIIQAEIELLKNENLEVVSILQSVADGMPAIGIVAAVLGVIHTMGSIDKPPEVLGILIAGALVGTFLGIFVSYGFVAPLAHRVKQVIDIDNQGFDCVKAGLMGYLNELPPIVAVEAARKTIPPEFRPSYQEIEEKLNGIDL